MISNQDRSGYFGASDSKMVCSANRSSKTFLTWWEVKLGWRESPFTGSRYTNAGNLYEHPILESIDKNIVKDGQIIIEDLKLRVNYDGYKDGIIYEVKTHNINKVFEVSKAYWMQAQVEMFAYQKMAEELGLPSFNKLYIVSYPLREEEYNVTEGDVTVDFDRIKFHEVKYSKGWIKGEYLSNLKQLVKCLVKEKFPK